MADLPDLPDLRASDADRERTAEVLRHAAAEGRLTVDELDQRLHDAYRGVTTRELDTLVADVVAGPAMTTASRVPVRPAGDDIDRIVSVMGGATRKGRWRIAPVTRVTNVMGGADLDLNDAELGAQTVQMRVFSFWGGADIRLPEALNVEVTETNIMGGNDLQLGEARPDPGGPVLKLRGAS
jgi:Domain of unknown function (DUF1707)